MLTLFFRNAKPLILKNKTECTSKDDFKEQDEDLHKEGGGDSYVLYIEQRYQRDFDTWTNIAKCLKIWDLDVRGFHKQAWRIWVNGNQLTVVGSNSPYYRYKPDYIKPVYFPKIKKQ